MGSEGGTILLHYLGPGNETRSFMHVDRPNSNSGPGQENIDLSCFQLGQSYELKAKIKLVDENGFPYHCEYNSLNTECDNSCPEFVFTYMDDNTEQFLLIPNNITDPWIAEEFNEYYAIFEVTQDFLNSPSAGFYFRGPRGGVGILLDDVVLTAYTGNSSPTIDTNPGVCFSLVISGDADVS